MTKFFKFPIRHQVVCAHTIITILVIFVIFVINIIKIRT